MKRILIDGNSVGHAAHQGTLLHSGEQQTQAIFGVIKAARGYRMRYPDATILWLWDGDSWRKRASDVYKKNRTDTPEKLASREKYKSQMPFIRKGLSHLGQHQVAADNYEADDLAAMFSRKFKDRGDEVRLITGDQDWLQLISENVIWEDHRDAAKIVSVNSFQKYTGFSTIDAFVQSKALQGDVSDNLPGVGQIGETRAVELLSIWGSVQWFLADPNRNQTYQDAVGKRLPKYLADFALLEERQAKFFHNMHLMSLVGDLPTPVNLKMNSGSFDVEAFRNLCHMLGFGSIYSPTKFDNWVEPFITGQK